MRGKIIRLLIASALLLVSLAAPAGLLDSITQKDAVAALRATLSQGAVNATARLGLKDGFLANPQVKIPLPGKLQDAQKLLQMLGLGARADELVTTMNRAAEAAMPEARTLLVDSVKQMTPQDAKGVLSGGDDAGTQYFRRTASDKLREKFLPIVKRNTEKLQLANQYNSLAGQAGKLGLVNAQDVSIEAYVTNKALDGLFLMIANEERAIRKDPVGQGSALLKKVFGALKPAG
jgi:hypothetical protein